MSKDTHSPDNELIADEEAPDPAPYIGYLEKEMTIMGVLSAFCIGCIALLAEKIIFAGDEHLLLHWQGGRCFIFNGATLVFVASFLFYIQRSDLAYLYGQICLGVYRKDETIEDRINEADSWENWAPYQQAFTCLSFAVLEMIMAAIAIKFKWFDKNAFLISITPVFLAFLACCLLRRILEMGDIADSSNPYKRYLKKRTTQMLRRLRGPRINIRART